MHIYLVLKIVKKYITYIHIYMQKKKIERYFIWDDVYMIVIIEMK